MTGAEATGRIPNLPALCLAAVSSLATVPAQSAEASLTVCVRRDSADASDFAANFAHGPIRLPAGVIFDLAGHTFGGASDPLDGLHSIARGGWRGVSAEERARREHLMVEDAARDQRHTTGVITLAGLELIKAKPCMSVPVAAVQSTQWGWTVSPVFGAADAYYQAYGVMHDGGLNTDWSREPPALRDAGIAGALNGVLQGTTTRVISVE